MRFFKKQFKKLKEIDFLKDEAGQTNIDKGRLSTLIVTYGIPVMMAGLVYVLENPSIVNDSVGPVAGGFILAIIGSLVFNYQNPRTNEESVDE